MGQAKNRAKEIQQLKSNTNQSKANEFGLLDVMFKFGDGEWAEENRNAMLTQILNTMKANIVNIANNAQAGKTTKAEGIQVGFEPGKMTTIPDYHISVEHPGFLKAMQEFDRVVRVNPKAKHLQMGYMVSKDIGALAPFLAYMNPVCNIVITKWKQGTIIRFFDNTGVEQRQATGDLKKDATDIANFAREILA